MTNEEIITTALKVRREILGTKGTMFDIGEVNHMMNVLRDLLPDTEQAGGVDVWISWTGNEVDNRIPCVSRTKPEMLNNGDYCQTSQGFNISRYEAQSLNLSPGDCAKFKIVRCE